MFTLVICLVVVALSGAAVLHVTLADQTKRATSRPHRPRGPAASPDPVPNGADVDVAEAEREPEEAPAIEVPPEPPRAPVEPPAPVAPTAPTASTAAPTASTASTAAPTATRDPATASVVVETHRARSAGLLVVLLTTLGGVLALIVAVLAVVAVIGLRAALVG